MGKIEISNKNLTLLKKLSKEKKIFLGGKMLDYIDLTNPEVKEFINNCKIIYNQKVKDREQLGKELKNEKRKLEDALEEITETHNQVKKYTNDLEVAKRKAENAKDVAENDLDVLHKKAQIETFDKIVKFMIYSIVGGMLIINILFGIALFKNLDNQILMTTWASTMTMVFTNAFSIIATIMGVKKIMQENKDGNSSTSYEK